METGSLTPRQLQVLRLLAQGEPDKRIAQCLQISPRCVRFHVGKMLARLGCQSRTRAVALALMRGLIPLHDENGGAPPSYAQTGERVDSL